MTTKAKTSPRLKAILRDRVASARFRNAIDNGKSLTLRIGSKTYKVGTYRNNQSPKASQMDTGNNTGPKPTQGKLAKAR